MTGIRTLADQLREQLRSEEKGSPQPEKGENPPAVIPVAKPKKPPKPAAGDEQATAFFTALEQFRLDGTEKSLIRLDSKTMNLLKRLKLAKGIDMNRFIVYSLHQYIGQHPWLPNYIQETLKKTEL